MSAPPRYSVHENYATWAGEAINVRDWLKFALGLCVGLIVVLAGGIVFLTVHYSNQPLPVIREYANGNVEVLRVSPSDRKVDDVMVLHFLAEFTKMHRGRVRATAAESFGTSLQFLTDKLRAERKTAPDGGEDLKRFLSTPGGNDIFIEIEQPSLFEVTRGEDGRVQLGRAFVDYVQEERNPMMRSVISSRRFRQHVSFTVSKKTSLSVGDVNPIGLTITELETFPASN